ncbi:hypothetical protein OZX57_00740 [Bifidobacterium sp. ESL0682]|uniref:hypothetical protein n=1 Tax=Bifidobacterium sp. ESL0682 TaxID=2983212 RepID=UPI0023F773BC|nr:hypothetical protein [Bifidobacterium sp. ESL0682]WEV42072.1 hypothetical protein OZX57_00740 [Bifidobacterium sp. ESL0682]
MERKSILKRLLCALAVLAVVVVGWFPANFVLADAEGSAAANKTRSVSLAGSQDLTQADYPAACTQSSATADFKVDCKPKLYQFMGDGNRMQGNNVADELRMDFVVRMPHGMVNPQCVALGGASDYLGKGFLQGKSTDCGMQIVFSRTNADGKNTDVADKNTRDLRAARYINTYGGDGVSVNSDARQAAATWAKNMDEYYTIHNVLVSGDYDFVTISLKATSPTALEKPWLIPMSAV